MACGKKVCDSPFMPSSSCTTPKGWMYGGCVFNYVSTRRKRLKRKRRPAKMHRPYVTASPASSGCENVRAAAGLAAALLTPYASRGCSRWPASKSGSCAGCGMRALACKHVVAIQHPLLQYSRTGPTPTHTQPLPHLISCRSVLTAAQLLSEGVATQQQPSSFAAGFDWAAEQLRQAGFEQLAAEVSCHSPAHDVLPCLVSSE
jgi:hypothetical protein